MKYNLIRTRHCNGSETNLPNIYTNINGAYKALANCIKEIARSQKAGSGCQCEYSDIIEVDDAV